MILFPSLWPSSVQMKWMVSEVTRMGRVRVRGPSDLPLLDIVRIGSKEETRTSSVDAMTASPVIFMRMIGIKEIEGLNKEDEMLLVERLRCTSTR